MIVVLILLAVMSCRLADKFVGGGLDLERRGELWSDVPKMDGLEASELEMPLAIKVLMRTVLNNLWRFNREGEDKTPVSGDWIVFTSAKTAADIQGFYSNDRMSSFGKWDSSMKPTCVEGKEKGIDGVFCVFHKIENGKEIMLAVIAMQDDKANRINLFFLRLEKDAEPEAANTSIAPDNTSASPNKNTAITKLNGSAPYGIEKRPMPSGTDLDQLLPKRVGPYTHVTLERSEQRGTTPTSLETDGNSVYATYKNGDKEIFVEFSVASTPENAQAGWEVVVGDANEGIYPSDPRFGSFRTEPSYLKVVNEGGAFFAWTRGGYFITAHAKRGETELDVFMNAFPF